MKHVPLIRPINPNNNSEIELVATRMRQTLVEVLGQEKGFSMYTMDWLKQRIMYHLDPTQSMGQVFVSEDLQGKITGHCIVRIEEDKAKNQFGLFSTTYIDPKYRNLGIASHLLQQGEKWMIEYKMTEAATYTDQANTKLINLYKNHGYAIVETYAESKMIKLARKLI